ncbi:patatin-like phospholipase family protein [Aliiroseovarius sp. 2305UL8-7]|uniref:patatin-like phospholipase family protein n=1 Tax=Aliiroseovarius conchicola TaxID=3121637 RepID=UPI003526E71D
MLLGQDRSSRVAVVLQGGGARGAYQIGVLRAIADIAGSQQIPFQLVCGVSVGAITAASVAAAAMDFQKGVRYLETLWRSLTCDDIYDVRGSHMLKTAARWAGALVFGRVGLNAPASLLDATPLAQLLGHEFHPRQIDRALRCSALHALCVTATSYEEGKAVTFFQGDEGIAEWTRARRYGLRAEITAKHLLASAALPFAFAPTNIAGRFYGDGALRQTAPLSPAIHAGADRILVISTRDRLLQPPSPNVETSLPTIGNLAGHMVDIVFNDNLDADLERLCRINEILSLMSWQERQKTSLKVIDPMILSPSTDLRRIVIRHMHRCPSTLRTLLGRFGFERDEGRMASYLLFDPRYIGDLIELGKADAMARAEDIRAFLASDWGDWGRVRLSAK